MRSALALAAVLYLVLMQSMTAAHAGSAEALAPGHDVETCVLCVAVDRNDAPAPLDLVAQPIVFEPFLAPATSAAPIVARRATADPPVRAPPTL